MEARTQQIERPAWGALWEVVMAVAVSRLKLMSRYPGALFVDIVMPVMIAAIPVLMGRSLTGPSGIAAFE